MSDLESQKKLLRSELRARRAVLSEAQQQQASEKLYNAIAQLPRWDECRSIALYLANDGEIDPSIIVRKAGLLKKQVYLPVVEQNTLAFAQWNEGEPLAVNHFGIWEPGKNAIRQAPDAIDVICLPLVAWNKKGERLGMGGGFYDRALANVQGTILVGLGHCFQDVDDIPMQDWDVHLQYVATEESLIECCP